MKKVAIVILSLFFVLAVIAGFLQSPWGKNKVISILTEGMEKSGLKVEIKELKGSFPYRIELKNVEIQSDGLTVTFESLEIHLSLLRLLLKELFFTEIKGNRVSWTQEGEFSQDEKQGLPFLLSVQHFQFTNVSIPDYFLANFEGHLRIGKKNRYALLDTSVYRPDYPDSSAHLIVSIQKDQPTTLQLDLKTPTLKVIPFSIPIDGSLFVSAKAQGSLRSFFNKKGKIQATANGTFSPVPAPFLGNWLENSWTFSSQLIRNEDQNWNLTRISGKNDFFNFSGNGEFGSEGQFQTAQLQIQSDYLETLEPLPLAGRLFTNVDLHKEGETLKAKASWRVPRLTFDKQIATEVTGNGEGTYENGSWKGNAFLKGEYLAHEWKGNTDFYWARKTSVFFPSYQLESPFLKTQGSLEVRRDRILVGTTEIIASQIHPFSDSLYGNGTVDVIWYPIEQEKGFIQAAHISGKAFDFYWNDFSTRSISFYFHFTEPLKNPEGDLYINLRKAKWKNLSLETASLETSIQGENWPYKIFVDGEWKHPLILQIDGYWRYKNSDLLISFQNGAGSFFNHPISLKAPSSFEYSPTAVQLKDLSIRLADGSLFAFLNRSGDRTEAQISANRVPIDFLSINPLDVGISGLFDLEANLKEKDHHLTGDFKTSIQQMQVMTFGQVSPLSASGVFKGHFDRDLFDIKGSLTVRDAPLFNLDFSLPVHLEIWPFQAKLLYHKKAKGHLTFQGNTEDFLDFFDLGMHRLEGECSCNLAFSNSLAHPMIKGYCRFENGYYQNYFTGTELYHLKADWIAKKDTLYLRSLTAQDVNENGSLSAKGQITFAPADQFPFQFDTEFSRFTSVAFDLVTSELSGQVQIAGNLQKALVTGNTTILESDITIPNRIPRKLPDLKVVYKNAMKPPVPPEPSSYHPYPLHLDLNVDAPEGIYITGRGLDSEWKGKFHIGGTQTAITTKGKIELIKGEFLFSGRKFKLTEGALSFSGLENEMPFLNLAATIDVKDVTIVARLKGPLNDPQITLQSVPPLSMGAIMSYLLFGQDMSEINSFQALQLANSLSSLAGEGPDVLETTRRSLGVDRLQIITVPSTSEEGGETIAVQVGKYVTEGVLVSFSQGAEDASTNVSIEVELKGGLSFVLESQQAQEQGKFTLRWSHNY